jgi:hypothetical protein
MERIIQDRDSRAELQIRFDTADFWHDDEGNDMRTVWIPREDPSCLGRSGVASVINVISCCFQQPSIWIAFIRLTFAGGSSFERTPKKKERKII